MPLNVHGLKDVNEAVRPAAASPRKSPAEELADALQLGAYAAEDQKNERWKDARRGFFAAHSALQRLIQEQPDMSEPMKISLRHVADRYWESATSAGQALRQAADGVDALSNPTPTPAPDAGELIPGCGEKGHQLASDRPAPENPEDMRAKRIAALGQPQAATPNSWVIDLLPRAKAGAPPNAGGERGGHAEFYGGDQVLVHAPNDKQVAARSEASAFTGEGRSIAGPRDEGVVVVPPAIHPLAAAAPSSAGAAPPPTPAAAKNKLSKFANVKPFNVPVNDPYGGGYRPPPPVNDPYGIGGYRPPPTRFQVGERVQCNMGLKDGTYSWLAGIVEAIDVWACSDGTVHKQYKYQVKLDDRTIGCVFAPEDTAYFIRAEGGTPASPDLPPPTPPSAFGSFRFGVGDSVACLMWTDDHRKAWFPGVVTHVAGWTQGRYYVYRVQLDDGGIAYVPEDSDAICVSKTPKVVVTALGTFSTTHENAVARDALELVQKLLLNIIKNPDEPKYRIVKLANPRLQTKLFCLSGGIALMQSLGFEKHANEELELPRVKPIATLTRCHLAVQDALDLLACRAVSPFVIPGVPKPDGPNLFGGVQDDGSSLARALVDNLLNQISKATAKPVDETLLPQRSISKVASTAAAAVQKELAEAPATQCGSVWLGDRPVSWSTFLLPADAAARRLFPLADLSSETNIVDPLSGRSCLAWQPPVSCVGTVEPELLRACELHPLATLGDGNCLLHAAALGAWGVHDRAGTKDVGVLRSMVFNLLNNEQFVRVLLPRMRAEQVSVMTKRPRSRAHPPHNPDAHLAH